MNDKPDLLGKLVDYGNSDFYPFHMPGHKRQVTEDFLKGFPNPYSIDITEIDGFDNLHHPEGILKESMDWAAKVYGADRTYYLVNGSSCGILSAICGTTSTGGTILMSRNCHKSAYHGLILNRLNAEYVYPQILDDFGLQGGLLPDTVADMLKSHPEVQAVLVVSPTYDGIVSDIQAIAQVVHSYDIPLIVDEAHGAHFPFGKEAGFPVSALELGADVVIQSLHKTLPSFTQTAVMHVKKGYVNMEKLDRYVHIFQSSSPSYIFMAGIDRCVRFMAGEGRERINLFREHLIGIRRQLEGLRHFRMLEIGDNPGTGVFDMDLSKIVISTRGTEISGAELSDMLREQYHLEMEMCGPDYVTAITTLMDTEDGLKRLGDALLELDSCVKTGGIADKVMSEYKKPVKRMNIADAMDGLTDRIRIEDSVGKISGEFVYAYPPGIPIVAPGEVLSDEIVSTILEYKQLGLSVQGMEDEAVEWIITVEDNLENCHRSE